jgi:hypothetical protein
MKEKERVAWLPHGKKKNWSRVLALGSGHSRPVKRVASLGQNGGAQPPHGGQATPLLFIFLFSKF